MCFRAVHDHARQHTVVNVGAAGDPEKDPAPRRSAASNGPSTPTRSASPSCSSPAGRPGRHLRAGRAHVPARRHRLRPVERLHRALAERGPGWVAGPRGPGAIGGRVHDCRPPSRSSPTAFPAHRARQGRSGTWGRLSAPWRSPSAPVVRRLPGRGTSPWQSIFFLNVPGRPGGGRRRDARRHPRGRATRASTHHVDFPGRHRRQPSASRTLRARPSSRATRGGWGSASIWACSLRPPPA